MSNKDAYAKKIEAKLEQWSAELDGLKARAKEADADARIELNNEIDNLKVKKRAAEDKLQEFRSAGEDAWEDLKHGMEGALAALDKAVSSARSRFK